VGKDACNNCIGAVVICNYRLNVCNDSIALIINVLVITIHWIAICNVEGGACNDGFEHSRNWESKGLCCERFDTILFGVAWKPKL
jgi:hypothetical protein